MRLILSRDVMWPDNSPGAGRRYGNLPRTLSGFRRAVSVTRRRWLTRQAAFTHLFMNLTKDQIQKLAPEQQDAVAAIVVKQAKARERLLKQVGHYRAMSWLPGLVIFPLYLAPVLISNPKYDPLVSVCVSMSLWFLIQFHAAGVNRRLDALVKLMEDDNAA